MGQHTTGQLLEASSIPEKSHIKSRVLILYRHAQATGTANIRAGLVEGYIRTLVGQLNKLKQGPAIKVVRQKDGALLLVNTVQPTNPLSPIAIELTILIGRLPVEKKILVYQDTVNRINDILGGASANNHNNDLGI
jgi:hypothetical protein